MDAAGPGIVGKAFYLQDDQLGEGSDADRSETDGETNGAGRMYDNFGGEDLDASGEAPLRVNAGL